MNVSKQLKSRISTDTEGKRAYLMSFDPTDLPVITSYLDQLADVNGFTKLFVKINARYAPQFILSGYSMEAFVPNYYEGKEDAFFLGKYFDAARSRPETEALAPLLDMLQGTPVTKNVALADNYEMRILTEADTGAMTTIFKEVFDTYPFPVFDTTFIIRTMQEGTTYFGIFDNGKLVAISSAECDIKNKSAEMTDFAVLRTYRGKNFAYILLHRMEKHLIDVGYKTLFTIARLHAGSMNKTFFNAGYKYSGTLTRNTQIAGNIESMNVWYKSVKP